MSYEVVLSRNALKYIKKLPPNDRELVKGALLKLSQNPWFTQYKKLRVIRFIA
ncbi:type II toxin-antitoxin system RelE family toxin [Thermococcus prieurii]